MRNSENTDGVTLLITLEFMTISKTISRIIYRRLAILFLIHHFYARSQIFATRYNLDLIYKCYVKREYMLYEEAVESNEIEKFACKIHFRSIKQRTIDQWYTTPSF